MLLHHERILASTGVTRKSLVDESPSRPEDSDLFFRQHFEKIIRANRRDARCNPDRASVEPIAETQPQLQPRSRTRRGAQVRTAPRNSAPSTSGSVSVAAWRWRRRRFALDHREINQFLKRFPPVFNTIDADFFGSARWATGVQQPCRIRGATGVQAENSRRASHPIAAIYREEIFSIRRLPA
jgi:hypothetical protein